ncbi:hypothetical protein OPV22_034260 [Ensete ventricosum]|uniref:DUF985 domain-containing protein n=1 Tax=Ensete ventricosum TaxID=4639 RepID=A0AAV8PPA5_ENSVE|nr:hypothetical protein OPV22_034260 [Ensete ventricosum]
MASPSKKKASEVLNLKRHPQGGFYFETFRDLSITLAVSRLRLPQDWGGRKGMPSCIILLLVPPAFPFQDFELAVVADLKAIAPPAEPVVDYLVLPS